MIFNVADMDGRHAKVRAKWAIPSVARQINTGEAFCREDDREIVEILSFRRLSSAISRSISLFTSAVRRAQNIHLERDAGRT